MDELFCKTIKKARSPHNQGTGFTQPKHQQNYFTTANLLLIVPLSVDILKK
jgi:hypothetical protein